MPVRNVPYDSAPGYYAAARLWLFGNVRLLQSELAFIASASGLPQHSPHELAEIEAEAERLVFENRVLVCAVHNAAHQRAAVVPLRWGSPRIVVLSGGFHYHLGLDLKEELFRTARLWRYQFDPYADLVVSRRAPDKLPTYARHNPTVDRMIELLAHGQWPGLQTGGDPLNNLLARIA